jgi:AcrR family transcriptional regulator
MPKGFTEHEKELIEQRLLEQGYKLFSAHGLRKTNIEEIARAAGISKGAFYNFFESKEALFMEVIEQNEVRLRQEILAVIKLPGQSPRVRLYAVLKKAFTLIETMPIFQFITGSDYDLIFRRLPPERLQQHLTGDRRFLEELVAQCRQAGISIQAEPEQIIGLLYPLVLANLHQDELGRNNFSGNIDLALELVAAYCLGEVELQVQNQSTAVLDAGQRNLT